MALPRIPSPDPVTIPATPERTYQDLLVTDIRLHYFPGQRASMGIGAQNYNYDTDEILDTGRPIAVHHIEGLAAEMQRVPALDTVVREMVRVSLLLLRESILKGQIQELTREISDLAGQIDDLAARIKAQERVAPQLLCFFDTFQQETRPLTTQFEIDRNRRLKIRGQLAKDWDQRTLRRHTSKTFAR